jgi:hypothetical protein
MATVAPSPPPPARRVAGQTRVFLFCHSGKPSSSSPLPGEPTTIVVVALRGEEYHVVAAVKGHELETPEAEQRPRLKRLLEATHIELNGKVFVNTQRAPTWRDNCRRFGPARTVNRPVNLLLWDRLTDISTYGPSGSEEDDEPDFCRDFSGLGNPSAMRDFMTACDCCLSDCSDGSRSLDDEDCGPSRECFHVDLGGPSEGNHLGMPENGDLPRHVPRVDILRELGVVPVQAGGHDPQLEQIRGLQARLDEGAGTLEPICRDVGQEWAGQPPAGEMHHLPQGIQHCIADDVRVRPPPTSSGVGQNLAAAAMLLRAMPEPSTTEGRRIQ